MKREAQSRWNIMKSINDYENRFKEIGIELQDEEENINKLSDFETKLSKISLAKFLFFYLCKKVKNVLVYSLYFDLRHILPSKKRQTFITLSF